MLGYLFEEYVNPRLKETTVSALLEVEGLRVTHRATRSSTASTSTLARGRGAGAGGRVGLRQDDHRAGADEAAAAARSSSPGRSPCARPGSREPINIGRRTERGMNLVRWRHISLVFQGAMNSLDPVQRVDAQIAEAIRLHERDRLAGRCASGSTSC